MLGRTAEIAIAMLFIGLGLITVFIWLPFDSETAMIETFRRQTTMGDAFVPTVAGAFIVICAAIHLILNVRRSDTSDTERPAIDESDLAFLLQLSGITAVSLAIMFWAGPLAVALFSADDGGEAITYRQMRGTYPFKLVCFVLGGFTMVFFITALIEGRARMARVVSSILFVVVLIAIFDMPLDTVLLPPNGDW